MNSIIKQKFREIRESISIISENVPATADEFKELGLVKDGIYKRLEFCIQNLIDVFSIVYSSRNIGAPSNLDDVFVRLSQKKVFSSKIITLVMRMKGLRNILAHRYGDINDDMVYELITEKLDDFEIIMCAVEKYLQK